jgi:uncharacterized damage-inducible protein DinB
MIISKPEPRNDFYYTRYIGIAPKEDLISSLEAARMEMNDTLEKLSETQANYRYQEDKWTVKQVLAHCIDCERILMYRALCFSRKEEIMLPGFDEDSYAKEEMSSNVSFQEVLQEYNHVRLANIMLFKRMKEENLDFMGIANDVEISPREIGWTVAGHDTHHLKVIRERYLIGNQGPGAVNFSISW